MASKFWSSPNVEPKRNLRFRVQLSLANGGIEEWVAFTAQRPNPETSEAEFNYINHTFYFPGTTNWNEVDIGFVEPISANPTSRILHAYHESGYILPDDITGPTNGIEYSSMSKKKATDAINNIQVVQFDGDGNDIDEWTLHNPWIKTLDVSDLEWGNDDLTELTVTFRYDFARFTEKHENGPGVLQEGYDTTDISGG